MAVIKQGSKGKDVENLQTSLNKAKASPKLVVDGIFGKLTNKQTRLFQKKCQLKVDGKVGGNTLAALKFGGPLPTMEVSDYTNMKSAFGVNSNEGDKYGESIILAEKSIAKLALVATKQAKIFRKLQKDTEAQLNQLYGLIDQVISLQAKFEVAVIKDPLKAKKIASECAKLDKEVVFLVDKPMAKRAVGIYGCGNEIAEELVRCENACKNLKTRFIYKDIDL